MTDDQTSSRQKRLRAALRENLKRRKGQIRSRIAGAGANAAAPGGLPSDDDNRPEPDSSGADGRDKP